MAERPEDLNLPITVVQRIIKEALPDGVIVSKEARQTICRASSVFVLYLTSCAVTHANKAKRKTLAVNDILSAIGDMEFDSFTQPLNDILKCRKENSSTQANKKQTSKNAATGKKNGDEAEIEEDVEEEVDDVEVEGDAELDEVETVPDEEIENEKENEAEDERKNKKRKTENDENKATGNQEEEEEEIENNDESDESSNSENEID